MAGTVLVTGGFGLVGSETVKRLTADGRQVVVADLDTRANRKKAGALSPGLALKVSRPPRRWCAPPRHNRIRRASCKP